MFNARKIYKKAMVIHSGRTRLALIPHIKDIMIKSKAFNKPIFLLFISNNIKKECYYNGEYT